MHSFKGFQQSMPASVIIPSLGNAALLAEKRTVSQFEDYSLSEPRIVGLFYLDAKHSSLPYHDKSDDLSADIRSREIGIEDNTIRIEDDHSRQINNTASVLH